MRPCNGHEHSAGHFIDNLESLLVNLLCTSWSGKRGASLHPSPLRTVRTTCTVHGSSKSRSQSGAGWLMGGASRPFEVARLCCPEDTLPQIAHRPVGRAPVDARPVGLPLGSVCRGLPLPCPSMCNRRRALRVTHLVDVSRLSAQASALSTRLWIPVAFRRGGVRFFDHPPPTDGVCHPYG